MPLHLILLGPPASGKGTQGRRLAAELGLAYLSTGALLRQEVDAGGEAGRQIHPVLERGGYISDSLMCSLMEPWLEQHRSGWVLDGFPRTLVQDQVLSSWLAASGERVDAAIALEAPKDLLIARIEARVECSACRWSGNRDQLLAGNHCPECDHLAGPRLDDIRENFLSRFDEFDLHVTPVIKHYRELNRLCCCDASASIEGVAAQLQDIIQPLKHHGQTA